MKKLWIILLASLCIVGCTKEKNETSLMMINDDTLYSLYSFDGEKICDDKYKTFQDFQDYYIVTNPSDQIGYIDKTGQSIIKYGTYAYLERMGDLLVGSHQGKDQETLSTYINNDFFILDKQGKVLYEAKEDVSILKSGLLVVKKGEEYIVLSPQGKELYKGNEYVHYVNKTDQNAVVGFDNHVQFYTLNQDQNIKIDAKGYFQIVGENEKCVLLNDEASSLMIYVNLEKQSYEMKNIKAQDISLYDNDVVYTSDSQKYIYTQGKEPQQLTSYFFSSSTYLIRSSQSYGPHQIYKDGELKAELKDCQLYPGVMKINSLIFPVYVKDKGYQYYHFDGKLIFENAYQEAQPFDENNRAIVKENDKGYILIDENGKKMNEIVYNDIKYIGSSYYAVYNENGQYGIINQDGQELLPIEYTSMSDYPIVGDGENQYLILDKNGRSYVYRLENMKEVFSIEGEVKLEKKGYFTSGYRYFDLDGNEIR